MFEQKPFQPSKAGGIVTKWSYLRDLRDHLQAQADDVAAYLSGLDATPCGIQCSGCGTVLETEGDFARHFYVPDTRFLNLGNCPTTDRGRYPDDVMRDEPDEEDVAAAQYAPVTWDDPTETSAWDRS